MMIHDAINILLLAVILLLIGLWRPKWILFWMDAPSRFAIIMIFSVMFMSGMTLFGEGSRQKKLEEEQVTQQEQKTEKSNTSPKINDISKVEKTSPAKKTDSSKIKTVVTAPVDPIITSTKTSISKKLGE